ncbi:hypothetical protein NCG89_10275 [Spongiibacter taiwanensis]|uniref:hypothetical protein n=1 Tax=Spongiibacter taiwanensis TaxID=1748242 RepID=UPI002035AEA2|nr:hypothetical protein [Spongiibacter taiwanensis]USA41905.1 hypothetical protein NCG89_10275 [Spongiibacter taiwanensis]
MKYHFAWLALIAWWPWGAVADCQRPAPPQGLERLEASDRQAMLLAQRQVKDYLSGADDYLDCLDDTDASVSAAPEGEDTRRARIADYSRVMAEMNATAAHFSEKARQFNQR